MLSLFSKREPKRAMRVSSPKTTRTNENGRQAVYTAPGAPAGSRSLTAAGLRIDRGTSEQLRRLVMPWQARSLFYYDVLGEIKYAAQFYSRALANLELYVGEIDEKTGELTRSEDKEAWALLNRIQDPGGGRSGLLGSYGRLRFLTGEALLLFTKNADTGEEQWEMLSSDELRIMGNSYYRQKAPTLEAQTLHALNDDEIDFDKIEMDANSAVAYRLWNRHPRFSSWPDSTMQGVLEECEELILLTKAVRARARSRLAGNGILWLDDSIAPAPLEPTGDEDPNEDVFLKQLTAAMMTPIDDPGTAEAVVPIIVRVPVPEGRKLSEIAEHMTLVDPTQLYPETGLRRECIERIAIGLDMPPEILLGLADSNHWPCSEDTHVFTADRGFVTHDQLEAGDIVLSLDHATGTSEWVPLSGVRREQVTDMEMVRVQTPSVDALTTLDHRWPVLRGGQRIWTDGKGLLPDDRIVRAAPHRQLPVEPTHSDAFVELAAWFITEGTCTWTSPKNCQVRIGQSHVANLANVERIRRVLTDNFGPASESLARGPRVPRGGDVPPAWREDTEPRGMTIFHLNKTAYAPLLDVMESWRTKVAAAEFVYALTLEQLTLFLETAALGDGNLNTSGGLSINQRDPDRLAPFALAAVLAGRPISFGERERTGGFSDGTHHYLYVPSTRGYDVPAGETLREQYTGVIFCPQVPPTASFLARRNGKVFFTGNTSWQIDEQVWKAHLQPVAQGLVDDLTSAYFRPTLQEMNHPLATRLVIAFDASKVINHPDRTKDAKDLYDRRAVGKEALRSAAGFDDEDAPTEEELNEMIGVQVHDSSLAVYGVPALRSGSELEPERGQLTAPAPGVTVSAPNAGAPSTGAEAEAGPPANPDEATSDQAVTGSGGGTQPPHHWQIMGACELASLRCREAAGNRLRTSLRKDRTLLEQVSKVRTGDLCAAVGPERTRELTKVTEAELVAGNRGLMIDALRMFGLRDERIAERVCSAVEQHAMRTLYQEPPAPLPPQFASLVLRALEQQAVPR